MNIKDFFSLKKNKFFWINIAAMVLVVFILVFVVLKSLDSYTRHGQAIVVPDAKGMNLSQAEALFRNNNLNCIISDSTYVKDKPAGSVIDHVPLSGQKVKAGRTIYLTINTLSIPLRNVPDVADNSSLRQAQASMQSLGFKLTAPEFTHGERDWVYGVKYNGRVLGVGEKVPVGATLTLIVGDGSGEVSELVDSLSVDPIKVESGATDNDSWF